MRILILTLIIFYQCSKDNDSQDCIDKSKISNTVCIEIYDPVCGCNNITYSNDCYANANGITYYTKGECKVNL